MILGIDPGLQNTGWGIVDEGKLIECGMIKINGKDRLKDIYDGVEDLIKKYRVDEVAIESLFFAKNTSSAMRVAEAIGVIKLCGMNNQLEVAEYTPLQIKMALTGYGRASKEQVEQMVRSCLELEKPISPSHASDAVAVALTASFTSSNLR